MARPSETEIVHAPNHLKARAGVPMGARRGLAVDQMVARADATLARAGAEYAQVIAADIAGLGELGQSIRAASVADLTLIKKLYRKSFDIKSQAGMFGYAVMTEIAGSLCDFIDAMRQAKRPLCGADAIAVSVLDMHIHSLRLALDRNMKGALGPVERELIDGLVRVVEKTMGAPSMPQVRADG
jgi:chemotaxis protein histidine kinase CheA